MVMEYGPKLLLAFVTLMIGLWIIKKLVAVASKGMNKGDTDQTLAPFVINLISWVLKILLFLSVASMIGIETTSFIAIFSAATLAIGLALQGSLSNFAGGIILLIFKPYKVTDLIEAQGHLGVVKEIQIFNTILLNPQNKTIIVPNGAVAGNSIINYTTEGKLRVDLSAGISYESNIKDAKDVLMKVLQDHPKVLKDPAPFVGVSELGDSSVNFAVRPWANVADYWDVYFGINEKIKLALDEAGITIPFPQMDVHFDKDTK
ncbi:mechanosensitive ion channel family protein [Lentimicrobium sp. S6]|nr:mechanosensitive ion channel domain-containing protein [Lentimicrobium sp. S6]